MRKQDIAPAESLDLISLALPALKRAAEMARKIAIQTDTGIVVVRNGETVCVDAQTLRKEAENQVVPPS